MNFFSDFLVVLDDGLVPLARLLSLFKDLDDPTGCIGLGKPNGLPHLATSSSTLDSLDNSSLKNHFKMVKKILICGLDLVKNMYYVHITQRGFR